MAIMAGANVIINNGNVNNGHEMCKPCNDNIMKINDNVVMWRNENENNVNNNNNNNGVIMVYAK
jgi:hypothetical protein